MPAYVGLAVLATMAVAVGALRLAFPEYAPVPPLGPWAVGTVYDVWSDPNRPDLLAADPTLPRVLAVQVWYPAAAGATGPRAPYVPDAPGLQTAIGHLHGRLARLMLRPTRGALANAIIAAPLSSDQQQWPVLLYLTGAGGFAQMNTFQAEVLAANGYIVLGLDQPYISALTQTADGTIEGMALAQMLPLIRAAYLPNAPPVPDLPGGSAIPFLAQDAAAVLDHLASVPTASPLALLQGHLDLSRAGIFGVSLGGIVAARACADDPRWQACLFMDAPMPFDVAATGLPSPSLWLTRDAASMRLERTQSGGWPEDEIAAHQSSMNTAFAASSAEVWRIDLPDVFHINFTDLAATSPILRPLHVTGAADPRASHALIADLTLAFFDETLRGTAQAMATVLARAPGLVVQHRAAAN